MTSILNADERNYLMSEFNFLRKEIEDSKERTFKIISGQIFSLPIISVLSIALGEKIPKDNNSLAAVLMNFAVIITPFIVLILVLTFLHERSTMYRAGLYIRENIEEIINANGGNVEGWEHWLEKTIDIQYKGKIIEYNPRDVDKYCRLGFWVLSATYSFFSLGLSCWVLKEMMEKGLLNNFLVGIILLLYFGMAAYVLIVIRNCPDSTGSVKNK